MWSERVQNSSFCFNLAPLQFQYLSLEQAILPAKSNGFDRKRRRPLSDVDGGPFESKKKRRLRLSLITSRLSQPFSSPATYIYDRDRSKLAYAKPPMRRDIIWKAAMVNRFRIRTLAAQHKFEQERRQANNKIVSFCFNGYQPSPGPLSFGQPHHVAPHPEFTEWKR